MEYEILEELIEETTRFQKLVETLEELTKIQCTDGNWNYDSYMHGWRMVCY